MRITTDDIDNKRVEVETQAYKSFLRVARILVKRNYGKWAIVPDKDDPLRKFSLMRQTAWFPYELSIKLKEFRHRWSERRQNWTDRIDWHVYLVAVGPFARYGDKGEWTFQQQALDKLTPRCYNKIPQFAESKESMWYNMIESETTSQRQESEHKAELARQMAKITGLVERTDAGNFRWSTPIVTIVPINFPQLGSLDINATNVGLNINLSHEDFERISTLLGWNKTNA